MTTDVDLDRLFAQVSEEDLPFPKDLGEDEETDIFEYRDLEDIQEEEEIFSEEELDDTIPQDDDSSDEDLEIFASTNTDDLPFPDKN